jgi:hypothetical protein
MDFASEFARRSLGGVTAGDKRFKRLSFHRPAVGDFGSPALFGLQHSEIIGLTTLSNRAV